MTLNKDWKNLRAGGTPVSAAAMEDLEKRAQAEIDSAKAAATAAAIAVSDSLGSATAARAAAEAASDPAGSAAAAQAAAEVASLSLTEKDAPGGVPSIDEDERLDPGRLPLSAVTSTDAFSASDFIQYDGVKFRAATMLTFLPQTKGAVGDGVANDTKPMQEMIEVAVAAGGSVYLSKTFLCDGLKIPSNTVIYGPGKIVSTGKETLFQAAAAVSNVVLEGFHLDGAASEKEFMNFANGCSDIAVRRIKAANFKLGAFTVATGANLNSRIEFSRNRLIGNGGASNSVSISVANPYCVLIEDNTNELGGGFKCETSSAAVSVSRGIFIRGNWFKGVNSSCILVRPNGATTMEQIDVSNNHGYEVGTPLGKGLIVIGENVGEGGTARLITATGNSARFYAGNGISIGNGTGTTDAVKLTGNVLDGRNAAGEALGTTGIAAVGVTGLSLVSNGSAYTLRAGIRLTACARMEIVANTVEYAVQGIGLTSPTEGSEAGICVFTSWAAGTIALNTVRNSGAVGAPETIAGIGVDRHTGGGGYLFITVNRCYDDRAEPIQAWGVRIGVAGTEAEEPEFVVATNNICPGNKLAPVKRYGTLTARNCIVAQNWPIVADAVASASTITPLGFSPILTVSGKTEIKKITPCYVGYRVTLIFAEACKVVKGENLLIKETHEGNVENPLTLICDGTNWYRA